MSARALQWPARVFAVVLLVMLGATALVRFAPGYFSDVREMDARYAAVARAELAQEASRSKSFGQLLSSEIEDWKHGGGISRQFGIPVFDLIRPRLAVTGKLLVRSLVLAWVIALVASCAATATRKRRVLWQVPVSLLLAVPTAALATVGLLLNSGGPVMVMTLVLVARDFKFVDSTVSKAWDEPWLFQARAQGVRFHRLMLAHVLPAVLVQLAALARLSLIAALSALVPVEVIFDVPGLGKLAWNAAMNRDLPVLLAVTLLMALAVTISGYVPGEKTELERA